MFYVWVRGGQWSPGMGWTILRDNTQLIHHSSTTGQGQHSPYLHTQQLTHVNRDSSAQNITFTIKIREMQNLCFASFVGLSQRGNEYKYNKPKYHYIKSLSDSVDNVGTGLGTPLSSKPLLIITKHRLDSLQLFLIL